MTDTTPDRYERFSRAERDNRPLMVAFEINAAEDRGDDEMLRILHDEQARIWAAYRRRLVDRDEAAGHGANGDTP